MIKYASLLIAAIAALTPISGCAFKHQPPDGYAAEPKSEWPQPEVFLPNRILGAKETVEAYLSQIYRSYIGLFTIDMSSIIDTGYQEMKNVQTWLDTLVMQHRIMLEYDLCYVETTAFPYSISYEEEPEDNRMQYFEEEFEGQFETALHLRITGLDDRAYPPLFALNSQHTFLLSKTSSGGYKIIKHYYPGSERNFKYPGELEMPNPKELKNELIKRLSTPVSDATGLPDRAYSCERASKYALRYMLSPNVEFYRVIDWFGNCQNFVSQAVWYGLFCEMDENEWFAGIGGGTLAWENVDYFWDWAVVRGGLDGEAVEHVLALRRGDILQLRTHGVGEPDDFSHVIILTDESTLTFAQNSPPCLVNFSDLVNIEYRMFSPFSLDA